MAQSPLPCGVEGEGSVNLFPSINQNSANFQEKENVDVTQQCPGTQEPQLRVDLEGRSHRFTGCIKNLTCLLGMLE